MDGEWSDGAASSPTMSGGEHKSGDGVSVDCPGSPRAAAPGGGRRRSAQRRVVTVALADVSGPRPKGVGEGNTPTDSWAWRKYGQKPIKGSPFPRAYYRCSSSKGCPARKQVERSRADPDKVIVTYSFEHNHASAGPTRAQSRHAQKPRTHPSPPEPAQSGDATGAGGLAAAAVEVHDEFRWLYDVVSVTSSTSHSDIEAADELQLHEPMLLGVGGGGALLPDEYFGDFFGELGGDGNEEDAAMFEDLGELPECAMVFRRRAGEGLEMAGGVKVEQPVKGTAMT